MMSRPSPVQIYLTPSSSIAAVYVPVAPDHDWPQGLGCLLKARTPCGTTVALRLHSEPGHTSRVIMACKLTTSGPPVRCLIAQLDQSLALWGDATCARRMRGHSRRSGAPLVCGMYSFPVQEKLWSSHRTACSTLDRDLDRASFGSKARREQNSEDCSKLPFSGS